MKLDLHMHSKYSSDGVLSPKEIVKTAIKKGLDGIAVTDHNTIQGGLVAKEYETKNFKVIVGSEIMTDRGEVIGLFLEEEIGKSRSAQDVISDIRAQNGIVIIPHPFDVQRHAFQPLESDVKFIDCVEGFNSRCILKRYNEDAYEFGMTHNLTVVAGSDAHFANEIGNAGVIMENEDIRDALIKRRLKIFGNRTMFLNHFGSKYLRFKRDYLKFKIRR